MSPTDYPAEAAALNATGKVGFRLRVDATGRPDGCVVFQTSGSPALDNATCDLMLARARFRPATGQDGEAARGDYSARIAWSLDSKPEALVNQVIRVRSELDAAGRVTSCTATPADVAAELGGCRLFGDPRMLGHMIGRPLPGYVWIEVRVVQQVSTQPPVEDGIPDKAVRTVLGRSTVTITPAGTFGDCTSEVVKQFEGRALDLCALKQIAGETKFTPAPDAKPRQLTLAMEVVTQAR